MSGHDPWVQAGLALWRREVVTFFRQKGRVIGALGTPLMFWAVLGFGFGSSVRAGATDGGYEAFSFPGMVAMVLLFTAIFSSFSLISDRKDGFLQGVLVAPVSSAAVALGKLLGGATIATAQGALFLALAPLVHLQLSVGSVLAAIAVMIVVSFGLTGLGFAFAWRSASIQGFHGIMNLVLLPMWLLSGSVFPAAGSRGVVRWILTVNPLTYGVAALRRVLWPETADAETPGLALSIIVSVAFAAAMFTAAMISARRARPDDLQ